MKDWIRLDTGIIEHPRIMELNPQEFQILVYLWCVAGRSEKDGLIEYKPSILQRRLMLPYSIAEFQSILDRLVELDFLDPAQVGYTVRNWQKHQYRYLPPSAQPEQNRAKQQRFRDRKKLEQESDSEVSNVDSCVPKNSVTERNQLRNQQVTSRIELNRIDSIREEEEGNGVTLPVTAQNVTPSSSSSSLNNFFGDSEIVTPRQERERENTPSAPPPVMPGDTPEYWRRLTSAGWKPSEVAEALAKMKTRKDPAKFTPDAMVNYLTPILTDLRTRQGNSYQPPLVPPIDPEEAKRAKAVREAASSAWEAEQLADLDRKIENGRRKREERERNAQATATE